MKINSVVQQKHWQKYTYEKYTVHYITPHVVNGVYDGRVPGKVTWPRKTQKSSYVLSLEGKNHDPKRGPEASPTVRPL